MEEQDERQRTAELAPAARFSLRLRPADLAAAGEAIGLALPARIGARSRRGPRSALCLGPDEWTARDAPKPTGTPSSARLAELAAPLPLGAVEISDREITLALEGPAVLDLLATGCPRDLARMPVGSGTRTVFDTVQVVLTREADDRFRLDRLALLRAACPRAPRPRHARARRRPADVLRAIGPRDPGRYASGGKGWEKPRLECGWNAAGIRLATCLWSVSRRSWSEGSRKDSFIAGVG